MTRRAIPYPCIGYCMIDSRGYCVACGRPPTLGMPEACETSKVVKNESVQDSSAQSDNLNGRDTH